MKLLVKAAATFDHLLDFLIWLAGALLIFGWLSVCFEVFMRYFLNRPTIWVIDITEHILVWITFLGTTWLLRREGHAKIELLTLQLRPRARIVINSITSILCAIICLVVAWYGVRVVWQHFHTGIIFPTILELPKAPLYLVVPIGFFLLFIQFLRRTYGYLAGWRLPQATNKGSIVKP